MFSDFRFRFESPSTSTYVVYFVRTVRVLYIYCMYVSVLTVVCTRVLSFIAIAERYYRYISNSKPPLPILASRISTSPRAISSMYTVKTYVCTQCGKLMKQSTSKYKKNKKIIARYNYTVRSR